MTSVYNAAEIKYPEGTVASINLADTDISKRDEVPAVFVWSEAPNNSFYKYTHAWRRVEYRLTSDKSCTVDLDYTPRVPEWVMISKKAVIVYKPDTEPVGGLK